MATDEKEIKCYRNTYMPLPSDVTIVAFPRHVDRCILVREKKRKFSFAYYHVALHLAGKMACR